MPHSAANRRQDEEAERVAYSITNSKWQALALHDVAAALIEATESKKDAVRTVSFFYVPLLGAVF